MEALRKNCIIISAEVISVILFTKNSIKGTFEIFDSHATLVLLFVRDQSEL